MSSYAVYSAHKSTRPELLLGTVEVVGAAEQAEHADLGLRSVSEWEGHVLDPELGRVEGAVEADRAVEAEAGVGRGEDDWAPPKQKPTETTRSTPAHSRTRSIAGGEVLLHLRGRDRRCGTCGRSPQRAPRPRRCGRSSRIATAWWPAAAKRSASSSSAGSSGGLASNSKHICGPRFPLRNPGGPLRESALQVNHQDDINFLPRIGIGRAGGESDRWSLLGVAL